jgi:hypothetical protein
MLQKLVVQLIWLLALGLLCFVHDILPSGIDPPMGNHRP